LWNQNSGVPAVVGNTVLVGERMSVRGKLAIFVVIALAALASAAVGQTAPVTAKQSQSVAAQKLPLEKQGPLLYGIYGLTPRVSSPLQPLLNFKDSDVKFNLQTLMNTLRDNRHEGWVLAAYPDPKTSRPLIGAGFSLDLPAREHVQHDPLNPNQFVEPSSAQLWEAAGLEPQRLQTMLDEFDRELSTWKKRNFQRKARTHALFPEIDEEDAVKLLRISTIQAIHNARAYCRNFDQLTGPQQMALTQLVFQMGVNLEEFTQFLAAINTPTPAPISSGVTATASINRAESAGTVPASYSPGSSYATAIVPNNEYWDSVQGTLIHSDWARRYSTRAVSVIAMFDPSYNIAPWEAEARVRAEVHPLHTQRRHRSALRTASTSHRKSAARRTHKS
jgi:hypothetical protein